MLFRMVRSATTKLNCEKNELKFNSFIATRQKRKIWKRQKRPDGEEKKKRTRKREKKTKEFVSINFSKSVLNWICKVEMQIDLFATQTTVWYFLAIKIANYINWVEKKMKKTCTITTTLQF